MRTEDMLDLREGMKVIVSPAAGLATRPIRAQVRGIATSPLPVIGRNVIVEPEVKIGGFSCHPAFEIHLAPVNE
jgi:hypothetical protein